MMKLSEDKDIVTLTKKPKQENLSPHRVSVAILIYTFCKYREKAEFLELVEIDRRLFIKTYWILILKLIQSPDISLDEFLNVMQNVDHEANEALCDEVKGYIFDIVDKGARSLIDVVDSMGRLPAFEEGPEKTGRIYIRNCVTGYFLRRFLIYFDRLTFSEVTAVLEMYRDYARKSCLYNKGQKVPKRIISSDNDWCNGKEGWSRRQAELFISTQTHSLLHNTSKALSPIELHKQLKKIIESNPDLSEAHFLDYLNYMRLKDIGGALDSLYQACDKKVCYNGKTPEDKNESYRYAALKLAVLNFQLGHKEEAMASLKEAIKLAQEANDNICLQHALSWLCPVSTSNTDKLIEHLILKSLELNLSYIMSLGILSFGQYGGVKCGNPKQIFETVTRSDIINIQQSYRDLISNSYTQKSALWQFYGKTDMSSLWSQLLLNFSTNDKTLVRSDYEEGVCEALCNVANHIYLQGDYSCANSLLNFVREKFPNEPLSQNWMLTENVFQFHYHLYRENYLEAELIAYNIACVNKWEACLRLAEVLLRKQDYTRSHHCINKVLAKCHESKRIIRIDYQVRAMLLLVEIQCAISFPHSVPYGVLALLNSTLAYCKDFYIDYYTSIVQLHMANMQLLLEMPETAMSILDKCMTQILAHGSAYNRAQATLLYVKCMVATSYGKDPDDRREIILKGAKILNEVIEIFQKLNVNYGVKDVLYLQSVLYDEINEINERNRCAMEFKLIDDLIGDPGYNYLTLITLM